MFIFKVDVYARSISFTYQNWPTYGSVNKIVDGNVTSFTADKIWFDDDNSPAYCIDYGVQAGQGEVTESNLSTYLQNGISSSESESLIKKLNEYIYFGYNTSDRNTEKYFLATQKLIWEAVSNAGFYKSPYYKNNNTLFSGYSESDLNFSTIGFYSDGTIDISTEVSAIQSAIVNYYKTPSFCSNAIQLTQGEEKTLTDSNGVLSSYDNLSCSNGLTCLMDGNSLKVKMETSSNNQAITLTKSAKGTDVKLYTMSSDSSRQKLLAGGKVDAVTCNIAVSNTPIVYISKQDATTGKELPGAQLVLKDKDGNIIENWISTTEPHPVTGLVAGTYILTETIAPSGYIKSTETVTFVVKEDGTVDAPVVMKNAPEVIENPPTGVRIAIIMAWSVGLTALGYSIYYFIGLNRKKVK